MKNLLILMAILIPAFAQAQKVMVFEVRKSLQMSNTDPVYKDYYISGGFGEGLQNGMVIDVVRRTPIHDGLKNQSQGELVMTIAKLQVLHVQQNISVARLFSTTTAKNRPVADFNAIMVGDELDMNSAAMPVKKKKRRRKAASYKPAPAKVEAVSEIKVPDLKAKKKPVSAPVAEPSKGPIKPRQVAPQPSTSINVG